MTDSTFSVKYAKSNGGAIAAKGGAPGTINTMTGSSFNNNISYGGAVISIGTPVGSGAAIYISGISTNIQSCDTFSGNLPAGNDIDVVP